MISANPVGNPRFFACNGPYDLGAIASALGCRAPTPTLVLTGLASLSDAEPGHLSFLGSAHHLPALKESRAGAVLLKAEWQGAVPDGTVALVVADPAASWAQAAALFHPVPPVRGGVHRSAVVAETASVDPSAEIGPLAYVGERASIGPGCQVGPGAVIGDGVVLGPDCRVGPNASVTHAVLGARVYVYPGARIGQEGFGFGITATGFQTTPQLCSVILGDDVEVGANTTIDRGALRDTEIGNGTRLDNLVQVAHGVRIGRYCAIAALAGISGSAEIDDFVVMGGQVGVAEHVRIGSRTRIGAQTGVISTLEPGATVIGSPARPAKQFFREVATLKRLARRPSETPET